MPDMRFTCLWDVQQQRNRHTFSYMHRHVLARRRTDTHIGRGWRKGGGRGGGGGGEGEGEREREGGAQEWESSYNLGSPLFEGRMWVSWHFELPWLCREQTVGKVTPPRCCVLAMTALELMDRGTCRAPLCLSACARMCMTPWVYVSKNARARVCVCVQVRAWERERERRGVGGGGFSPKLSHFLNRVKCHIAKQLI